MWWRLNKWYQYKVSTKVPIKQTTCTVKKNSPIIWSNLCIGYLISDRSVPIKWLSFYYPEYQICGMYCIILFVIWRRLLYIRRKWQTATFHLSFSPSNFDYKFMHTNSISLVGIFASFLHPHPYWSSLCCVSLICLSDQSAAVRT